MLLATKSIQGKTRSVLHLDSAQSRDASEVRVLGELTIPV